MRQDFFDYVPQFTLVISGNYKPGLRAVDEAIRRRFLLIPFSVTIPPEERDPNLVEKLKAEWRGIFAWMIEGAVAWHQAGLKVPANVRKATDEYLETEDIFGTWIAECCTLDPQAWTGSTEL
jgi:putative DNA primase/helicase